MADLEWSEPPPRAELVEAVRAGLAELGISLRVLARDVLGADARIDLVAADPDGRVTLVLISADGEDLALLGLALAQRSWVAARLPDWAQLAPQQGLQPDAPVRLLLVGPAFSATALAAVRAVDSEDLDLVQYRCLRSGPSCRVLLEPARVAGASAAPRRRGGPPPAARFRTGLSDADLALTSEERRDLG